ncbi:hypothetical protein UCRPA7_8504 [Phaeoacremonium minimum UCRPA7]|uniref:Uncharacterized protein n=1 Tax=Phaeoacremonium minimum (strain UCR-PA7) TaxID=1286976 RepID=R8B9K7_PHAM7|nr:hypothetical protein UCRPA7_8504 [Phaeoacremonium minimum UCRPA7]EON95971.1 hypothetical protein UCRPA7_8504 [Phaeoacremonium minimum UCRPA7]
MDSPDLHFLDKYAINNCRRVYDHCVPQEYTKGTILHVRNFHSASTQALLSEEDREGTTPLVPTAAETAPVKPPKTTDCIWVGMALGSDKLAAIKQEEGASSKIEPAEGSASASKDDHPTADNLPNEARATKRKAGRNWDLLREPKAADIISFDPRAKRVVVKKVKGYSFWALNHPHAVSGLSTGYMVNSEQIYFFREFRDDFKKSQRDRWVASYSKAQEAYDRIGGPIETPQPANQGVPEVEDDHTADDSKVSVNEHENDAKQNAPIESDQQADNQLAVEANVVPGHDEEMNTTNALQQVDMLGIHVYMDQELQQSVEQATTKKGSKIVQDQGPSHTVSAMPVACSNIISIRDTSSDLSEPRDLRAFSPLTEIGDEVGLGIKEISIQNQVTERVADAAVRANGKGANAMPVHPKILDPESHRSKPKRHRALEDDGYIADDDNYQQQYTNRVAKVLKALIDKLQKRGQGALLHQIHTLAKCLDKKEGPAHGSALTVSLNIPDKIHDKDCSKMLAELYSIFPYLKADTEGMKPKTLAWMLKGLRLTGSSVDLPLIRAYLVAFNLEMRREIGDKIPKRDEFTVERLIDMLCAARDHAEAIVHHAGPSDMKAAGDKDFPHPDENGEVWAHMNWTDTRTT